MSKADRHQVSDTRAPATDRDEALAAEFGRRGAAKKLNEGSHSAGEAAFTTFVDPDADRFTAEELATKPPPPRLAIDPFVPRGVASGLTGAGGVGKGQLIVAMAVSKVLGHDFVGRPQEPGRVIIWSAEDPREAIQRAVHPLAIGLSDTDRRKLADGLIVKSTIGADIKLTRRNQGDAEVAIDVEAFIPYAKKVPNLALVVMDTMSRLNGIDESNEGLALAITAAEKVAVALDCGVVVTHHVGKAVMRAGIADQYSGRGGSSLADNARSMMHLALVTNEDKDAPTNAAELIREGRLLRLSHTKSNYTAKAPDTFIERVIGPAGPWLRPFRAEWDAAAATATTWAKLAEWFRSGGMNYPTASDVDSLLAKDYGARADRRAAISWALDQGSLQEVTHPSPVGRRKTYLQLTNGGAE